MNNYVAITREDGEPFLTLSKWGRIESDGTIHDIQYPGKKNWEHKSYWHGKKMRPGWIAIKVVSPHKWDDVPDEHKTQLWPIEDEFAAFDTVCPTCGTDNMLVVIRLTAQTAIPLRKDGFSTADAEFFDTSGEIVQCKHCNVACWLWELTR